MTNDSLEKPRGSPNLGGLTEYREKASPKRRSFVACSSLACPCSWVAVKELKLSYCFGETLLLTLYIYIYTHYGNLI